MKYLIVQDWSNTRGNHAGMVHMCKLLCMKYPNEYRFIVKETMPLIPKRNKILKKLLATHDIKVNQKKSYSEYLQLCQRMFVDLKDGDSVFLLEYCWKPVSQYELACFIHKFFPFVRLYALSHMTPCVFEEVNYKKTILKWSKPIDKMLTLGSSLSSYFKEIGVPESKISTGIHYVDKDYYNIEEKDIIQHKKITIIAMGAMKRDYNLLDKVVRNTPNVNWIICKGNKDVGDMFQYGNVRLRGYLEEADLRDEMLQADLSFNVMIDTVGSNVVTTSMACGLGMIVSDVGSIRDYCDDSNAVFCQNSVESFTVAINKLSSDANRVMEMRINSIRKSNDFTIDKIDRWFSNL